jgi:hypothetical protein
MKVVKYIGRSMGTVAVGWIGWAVILAGIALVRVS